MEQAAKTQAAEPHERHEVPRHHADPYRTSMRPWKGPERGPKVGINCTRGARQTPRPDERRSPNVQKGASKPQRAEPTAQSAKKGVIPRKEEPDRARRHQSDRHTHTLFAQTPGLPPRCNDVRQGLGPFMRRQATAKRIEHANKKRQATKADHGARRAWWGRLRLYRQSHPQGTKVTCKG